MFFVILGYRNESLLIFSKKHTMSSIKQDNYHKKDKYKMVEKEFEEFQRQSIAFDKWMFKILIVTIMLSLVFVFYLMINL